MKRRKLLLLIAVTASILCVASSAFAMSGAIWTSDVACTGVNINNYASKSDVYLNGGPAGAGAPGLPPGNYWVQATTPDGAVLGKSASAVAVVGSDGRFVQCYRLIDILYSASSGFSALGYDNTTNPGNVYKVWASMNPGFPNNASKTDNFKAQPGVTPPPPPPSASISGRKFLDLNLNGSIDAGISVNRCDAAPGTIDEPGVSGWRIELWRYTGGGTPATCANGSWTQVGTTVSNGAGSYSFNGITVTGWYKVVEIFPLDTECGDWEPSTTTCTLVNLTTLQNVANVNFGNICYAKGGLTMGYWKNWSGVPKGSKYDSTYNYLPISLNGCTPNPNPYTTSDPYNISTPTKAYEIFKKADASGDGKKMLAAQLLAAKLNVIKFNSCDFRCALYTNGNASYYHWSVEDIIAQASIILCNPAATKAMVTGVSGVLDEINNNETTRVLVNPGTCPVNYQ